MCKCKKGVPEFIGVDVLGRFGCSKCGEFFSEEKAIEYLKIISPNDTEEERLSLIKHIKGETLRFRDNISNMFGSNMGIWEIKKK